MKARIIIMKKGAFLDIPIKYNESTKTLIIGDQKGNFNGMLRQRKFNIVWVTKDNKTGIDLQNSKGKTVNYNGRSVSIRNN